MANNQRNFNVTEIISMLIEDGSIHNANVYIEPPTVHEDTDEDSGDESESDNVYNLNGRQLAAPATATIYRDGHWQLFTNNSDELTQPPSPGTSGYETADFDTLFAPYLNTNTETQPSVSGSTTGNTPVKRKLQSVDRQHGEKRKYQTVREWTHTDLPDASKARFQWNKGTGELPNVPSSPVGLFELFFDHEVLNMITDYSILYARSKGNMSFSTTPDEIKTLIGILLVSGYNPVPKRRMYWCSDEDVFNEAISLAMPRNRFEELLKYLHLCDNTQLDWEDKFCKVRPLLSKLNKRFLVYFRALETKDLNIDESMIQYYGRRCAKEFTRGKSIRFGYKICVLTTLLGYTIQFEPHQWTKDRQVDYEGVGAAGSVVLDLISQLQQTTGESYHLTFDSLFTSLKLVDMLSEKNIGCTCIISSNSIEDCPLNDVKAIQESPRGTYDYATDVNSGLIVVRWKDNNMVNIVSNTVGVNPIKMSQSWSKEQSCHVSFRQPYLVHHYNRMIGGVDRMDQNINKYRITIQSKKWWWPLFAYCIDLCIQQSWHLYRATAATKDKNMDLLEIRRSVARLYLARAPRVSLGRPRGFNLSLDKRVPKEVRYDRKDHLIEPWETQIRCAFCRMKTKHRCSKCRVGVHDRCFIQYHTEYHTE